MPAPIQFLATLGFWVIMTGCNQNLGELDKAVNAGRLCRSSWKSFTGCCSGHEGPDDQCGAGQYYFQDLTLVCRDGSIDSACRY